MRHIRTTQAILVQTEPGQESTREPYDLATAARLAEVHPERIRHYCRLGLLSDSPDPERGELYLDDHAVYEVRRIEYLRREEGVNLRGIRIILDLLRRTERLRDALHFQQGL